MGDETQERFEAGAEAWRQYNQKPLGRIRHRVTWQNLARHLPPIKDPEHPPRVLDVGGGTGELALDLALNGYQTALLDFAPAMIEKAKTAARSLPPEARARLSYWAIPVDAAPGSFPKGSFDVITCHTLIEYLDRPQESVLSLLPLLREGGLVSLSFVNRHAEVLRQVWGRGDPAGALARLETGGFDAGLFGLRGNAYEAPQIIAWLADSGMTVLGEYGVRAFADFVPRHQLDDPVYYEELLRLELVVTEKAPYSQIARYGQIVACKDCVTRAGPA